MNVLHVIPGLTWERGGPSAVVRALARRQAEAGHRVAVLTTDQGARNGERPVELAAGVDVERVQVRGPDRLAYAPGFARAVRVRLRDADVVHVHSIFTYPVHAALREARAAGVPAVLRPCGLLHPYSLRQSRLRKAAYLGVWGGAVRRACAAWHYTSDGEAAASWPGDSGPHFVLANGIDPDELTLEREEARRAVRATWPEVGDAPYVLFLGRLHPKKRLDLLVDAFLAAAPAPVRLVVAGPDECGLWAPLAARLPRAAGERVIRVPLVTGREKAALLAGAALFVLPSEHENFGIAPLEALAAGAPVLVSPQVDLSAAACSAGFAFTAPLHAGAWRERLAALLADVDALAAAGPRARGWARERYSWDRIAAALEGRYRWVLAGCAASGAPAPAPVAVAAASGAGSES